jgi:putative ABC transport system permease protein
VSVIKVSPAGEQPISGVDFLALRSESKTLAPIAAYVFKGIVLTEGEPERVDSAQVTADFFQTLGVEPILGRALIPAENQAERNHAVVISYILWQRRFGGDPKMIGRTITLDHELYTVVGVMPHDFQFPKDCGLWTPLVFNDESRPGEDKSLALEVIARLKPGGALDQSQAEVSVIAHRLRGDHPENNAGLDIKLAALRENSSQKENVKGKVLEIKIHGPADSPVKTGKEK